MFYAVSLALIAFVLGKPVDTSTPSSESVRSMRSLSVGPSGGIGDRQKPNTPLINEMVRTAKRTSLLARQQHIAGSVVADVRSEIQTQSEPQSQPQQELELEQEQEVDDENHDVEQEHEQGADDASEKGADNEKAGDDSDDVHGLRQEQGQVDTGIEQPEVPDASGVVRSENTRSSAFASKRMKMEVELAGLVSAVSVAAPKDEPMLAKSETGPTDDHVAVEFYAGTGDATALLSRANASFTPGQRQGGFMHLKVPADTSKDLSKWYTDLTAEDSFTSQVQQDQSIHALFSHEDNNDHPHFFLDLAANHPLKISNTFHLEHVLGWKGFLVEANPQYWNKYWTRKNLLIGAAVSSQDDSDIAFEMKGALGGVVGNNYDNKKGDANSVHYRTVSLRTLLQTYGAPTTIDYFSLDVEGAESDVMMGLPVCTISDVFLGCYKIRAMTVERPKKELRDKLKQSLVYIGDHGKFGDQLWVEPSLAEAAGKLNLMKNKKD